MNNSQAFKTILKRNKKYKQGFLNKNMLKNPDKFLNKNGVSIYRSSFELKFSKWCDLNENVKYWSSEEIQIKYLNPLDNKIHTYYPDFFITINEKKYIIEIKPYNETIKPKKTKYKQYKNFIINKTKWKYTKEYCKKNGFEFKIITEKDLF